MSSRFDRSVWDEHVWVLEAAPKVEQALLPIHVARPTALRGRVLQVAADRPRDVVDLLRVQGTEAPASAHAAPRALAFAAWAAGFSQSTSRRGRAPSASDR